MVAVQNRDLEMLQFLIEHPDIDPSVCFNDTCLI